MHVIETNHLTKYYGKARGIVDVSFHVDEGEMFGFIGPNGAGKSTTIRLLLSLIYPTSGSATIFGKDCIRASSAAVSLLLGTFFLSVIAGLNKDLEFLKYFSPFKYFDASVLLHESRLDFTFVGLSLAIILVSMVGAYLTYNRRDLYI